MLTPKECVIYMCGDKVFGTYNQAFYYYKRINKPIYYVLTLNMCKYRRVSELDEAYKRYCQKNLNCDSYDFHKKQLVKQMKFWKGELEK